MGRLILVVLLLAGAVAINPTLRTYAQPYVQPALDPVFEWSARSRLREVARLMAADRAMNRALPAPRDFPEYLRRQFSTADGHQDPWGTPFYLQSSRRDAHVGSAGRDRTRNTADDLIVPLGPVR